MSSLKQNFTAIKVMKSSGSGRTVNKDWGVLYSAKGVCMTSSTGCFPSVTNPGVCSSLWFYCGCSDSFLQVLLVSSEARPKLGLNQDFNRSKVDLNQV